MTEHQLGCHHRPPSLELPFRVQLAGLLFVVDGRHFDERGPASQMHVEPRKDLFVDLGSKGMIEVRQQAEMLRSRREVMAAGDRGEPVELVVRAGEPGDRRLPLPKAMRRVEGRAPAVPECRVSFLVPALTVPPQVAEIEPAAAEHGRACLETRIDADHERRVESAPRAACHADLVLIDFGPRFEKRHRPQERHCPVVDRRLPGIVAQLEAGDDGIAAGRAIAGHREVDAQGRVAAPGAELGPVARSLGEAALVPDECRQFGRVLGIGEEGEDFDVLAAVFFGVERHLLRDDARFLALLE